MPAVQQTVSEIRSRAEGECGAEAPRPLTAQKPRGCSGLGAARGPPSPPPVHWWATAYGVRARPPAAAGGGGGEQQEEQPALLLLLYRELRLAVPAGSIAAPGQSRAGLGGIGGRLREALACVM